jgi:hypothetical protein
MEENSTSTQDLEVVVSKYRGIVIEPTEVDLYVKQTLLKNCDFLGLFANRAYQKDELVCKYYGDVLSTREAMNLEDKSYLMRLGEQCYVDAKHHMHVVAR